MPQMFQVLRCYKCSVFQVHQTKKSNKFQCKLCGEKQSIKRHYGIGNGQECRLHVQKLNEVRGELQEVELSEKESLYMKKIHNDIVTAFNETNDKKEKQKSKWLDFIDREDDYDRMTNTPIESNSKHFFEDSEVLELPKKKRQRNNVTLNKVEKMSCKKKFIAKSEGTSYDTVSIIRESTKSNTSSTKSNESQIKVDNNSFGGPSYGTCLINTKFNRFAPPLNQNSKWAKFTNDDDSERTEDEKHVTEMSDTVLLDLSDNETTRFCSTLSPKIDTDNNQMFLNNNNTCTTIYKPFTPILKAVKEVDTPDIIVDFKQVKFRGDSKNTSCIRNVHIKAQSSQTEKYYDSNSSRDLRFDYDKITDTVKSKTIDVRQISVQNIESKPNNTILRHANNENIQFEESVCLSKQQSANNAILSSCAQNIQTLFSLCDDSELDNYLSI